VVVVVQARAAAHVQSEDASVDAALSTAPSGGSDQWPLTPSASMELSVTAADADADADAVPARADADSEPRAAGAFAVRRSYEALPRGHRHTLQTGDGETMSGREEPR
jgi:hypothetical protein